MGAPYQSQSATNYNASPPPDDGSTVAANKITWAKIKSALADSVKTLADAINTALRTALNVSPSTTSIAYTTLVGDHLTTIEATGTFTVSLGDAATMIAQGMGYTVTVYNKGTGVITVGVITGTDTLNGTAGGTLVLAPQASATFTVAQSGVGYDIISTAQAYGTHASTFTWDGSGGTSGSVTIPYQKVGGFVTLNIPALSATTGTSSTALIIDTVLPVALRPSAATQFCSANGIKNNTGVTSDAGVFTITTGGLLTLFRNATGAAFTNSAAAGTTLATTITYYAG